ncbi:MAG: hypothetical protein IIZ20_11635 [Butyrivibrio sp.]|uniref:DUF6462 family protein n=1 Tax=Butyrivibrio sp. AE3004 TaxID=1506994 RepID=UPI0005650B58|nr:DUF6462 family protein [Butyrivibrio sp. AE3004]MBQ1459140.1 hypothetical protein [Butyrivibrio sp.]
MKVHETNYYNDEKLDEIRENARVLRRKYLSYKEAELVYSLTHKKILELADQCGAIYRDGNIVRINVEIFEQYLERFHLPPGQYDAYGNIEAKYLAQREGK